MPSDNTVRKQSGLVPFKTGESGNPKGRPKGSRNKLGEDFVQALADDFAMNGVAAIERVRENTPEVYLRIVADLLPKDVTLNVNHYENMTDAQLLARLRQVNKLAGPLLEMALADDNETMN